MHICIHDFAGHPFQAELSRELARRGHKVTHCWFAADSGPKGRLQRDEGDAEGLSFFPVGKDIDYSKSNFFKRRQGDVAYGREMAGWISQNQPDIVISGNTPVEAQGSVLKACRALGIPTVFWCQDFFSIAASLILQKRLPVLGHVIGAYYRALERRQMQTASHIVHIAEGFADQTDAWGISRDKVSVIPNWGAIDEIDVLPRDTAWAQEQNLRNGVRFVYSGTLALKHNPSLLSALSKQLSDQEQVVLVSAGMGSEMLDAEIAQGGLPNLKSLPLQPFSAFPEVLGSADVLLAVLEHDAGVFSVPSKILSYLCAGRPIVLAAPAENLAAEIVRSTGAGIVVEPDDQEGFVAAALSFRDNPEAAQKAAAAGRAYAEEHFVISKVADRFEEVFQVSCASKGGH